MKPIRVLQVIGSMNRGGAETMIMNLYRGIDRTKVQFDFVENTFEKSAYDDEILSLGGRIYNCPHYVGKNHFAYKKWWNDFFNEHKGEYKIIHGHIGSTAAIYLKIAKKYGLYTIAHSHNTNLHNDFKDYIYGVYSYPTRFIADHLFACSKVAAISRYGKRLGSDKNKCTVLCNAIDTEKFKFDKQKRDEYRALLNLENKIALVHIGRFVNQKNHEFLIDVFFKVHEKNPNYVLYLIGEGPDKEKIEKKVFENDLNDSVKFLGVRSDIPELLQAMDMMIFPSLFEGLGIVVVEAQTNGLPCVISDKVPEESILIDDLVTVQSLDDSAEQWAQHIISRKGEIGEKRISRCEEIMACGYDISETAKWLEDFYIEKHGK